MRLDLNPLALVAAQPQDKLTCRLGTYENATWTVAGFFFKYKYIYVPFILGYF